MKIQTLGYQTDLIFAAFDGEILDRQEYLVIRSPKTPNYFWGNFLLFPRPPQKGDYQHWTQVFDKEFSDLSGIDHKAIGWDDASGEIGYIDDFLKAGYKLEEGKTLAATQVELPATNKADVTVQVLENENHWDQVLRNQIASTIPGYERSDFESFKTNQMKRYRKMAAEGLGHWFGAFHNGELVADLGIFVKDQVGRFQQVVTHPNFRGRGFCTALMYHASQYVFSKMGANTLVIIADENYHALGIYKKVGFKVVESQRGVCWWQKDKSL